MHFTDSDISKINTLVSEFSVDTEVAVAKIVEGTPCFYGASKSDTGVEQTSNQGAVFEIGSITKVITSSIMAKMAFDNHIDIDSPINPLFPFDFHKNQEITFKSLATHTSGLPHLPKGVMWKALFNKPNPYSECDEASLADYLQNHLKLRKKKSISYSNLGVGLLSVALEKAAGCAYAELTQEKVFKPLGMSHSSATKTGLTHRLVQGLDVKGNASISWDFGFVAGAGSVLSSVEDLAKFMLANFDAQHAFLELQRQPVIKEKHQCMALGWFIIENAEKKKRLYFHNGGTAGFSSAMLMDVNAKSGVIVLSNISGLHKLKGQKVDELCFSLMEDI